VSIKFSEKSRRDDAQGRLQLVRLSITIFRL